MIECWNCINKKNVIKGSRKNKIKGISMEVEISITKKINMKLWMTSVDSDGV